MNSSEIRQELKESLEMTHYRQDFIQNTVMILLAGMVVFFQNSSDAGAPSIMLTIVGIMLLPVALCHLIRVLLVFRKADHYVFCQCLLDEPHGLIRSYYFTVLLEDAEGKKYPVNTRAIFRNRGLVRPLMEDYVNATVTIAYNEATGKVVVIG